MPIELIEVPLCNGVKATCVGTDDHDIIWGTDGPDVIYAGDGNDIVQADEGPDIVCGGPGNDSIHGARGDDELFGDEGSDWLFGAKGKDTLWGGPGGFDVLWGGPGEDRLDGGSGIKDACLHQKDIGTADVETCEAIHLLEQAVKKAPADALVANKSAAKNAVICVIFFIIFSFETPCLPSRFCFQRRGLISRTNPHRLRQRQCKGHANICNLLR